MTQPKTDSMAGLILTLREQRVILDADLAQLYGVSTKGFNQAIKRNADRFPVDFAFRLTPTEFEALRLPPPTSKTAIRMRSQIVTTSMPQRRRLDFLPWAFTEHGAVMAANVLRSPKAVAMSVYVVRAFVRMREELMTSAVIFRRLAEVDKRLVTHDVVLRDIYEKLRPLLAPPPELPRKEMGFHTRMKRLRPSERS